MVTVYVDNNDLDRAIKRFKKLCEKHGIFDEIRRREYYMAPSLKRKVKSKEATRKIYQENKKLKTPAR